MFPRNPNEDEVYSLTQKYEWLNLQYKEIETEQQNLKEQLREKDLKVKQVQQKVSDNERAILLGDKEREKLQMELFNKNLEIERQKQRISQLAVQVDEERERAVRLMREREQSETGLCD